MTITAKIIADSISENHQRVTTFQLRYPRFIHAEMMTHRLFSRNASSSRAIPVKRIIEDITNDPAMPIFWGSNRPGMQAGDELTGAELAQSKAEWLIARDYAIKSAEFMIAAGLHKQIANRILEPWAHINVVVTATDWQNFFNLRCHKDAQPEIKLLADTMQEAKDASYPAQLNCGDWHLPYANNMGFVLASSVTTELLEELKKVSVSRCARVSYLTHDGRPTSIKEDLELFERLVGGQPLHASPAEHQATPDEVNTYLRNGEFSWKNPHFQGNLKGWIQYRKTLPGECVPN